MQGHRHGSDLVLLWLWHRLAAVALIQPFAWECPYAAGVTLNKQKQKNPPKNPQGGQVWMIIVNQGKVDGGHAGEMAEKKERGRS